MSKLDLQAQLVPTDELLAAILSHYSINDFNWQLATSGIENLTVMVCSASRKAVLRVYRQGKKDKAAIQQELDFVLHLQSHGLPVAPFIENTGGEVLTEFCIEEKRWFCVLMEFVEGAHPESYTPELLTELAGLQARSHVLGQQFAHQKQFSGSLGQLSCYYAPESYPPDVGGGKYSGENNAFLKRARTFRVVATTLPAGWVHLDFDKENILEHRGQVAVILDFDDLALAPLVACLGNTLWDLLLETNDETVIGHYLHEYGKHRELSRAELDMLPAIMLLRHYSIALLSATVWDCSESELTELRNQENRISGLRL